MRQFFARLCTFSLLILLFAVSVASAAFEETEGVKFGAFSIHPSLFTALRYVDNIYFVPTNYKPETDSSIPQGIESDFVMNLQPAVLLRLKVPTFTTEVGYKFYSDNYLGTDDPENRHSKLDAMNHTFSGLIDYQAPVGLFLKMDDTYVIQNTYEETNVYVDMIQGNQRHNEGHGLLGYRYGPEDNLYLAGKYTNIYDQYDEYYVNNRRIWYGDGDFRVKFLPKTSLLLQGGYGEILYPHNSEKAATLYYGQGGLAGQVTNHLKMVLKGGYESLEYKDNETYEGPIGQAEITGFWEETSSLTLGYQRQIFDAATTDFYVSDEGYFKGSRIWVERLATDFFLSYQYNEFSKPFSRHEDYIQGKIDLTLRMIFWLYFGGGYQYDMKTFKDDTTSNVTVRNIVYLKLIAKF